MPTTVVTFSPSEIEIVYKEPDFTASLNEKLLAIPHGIRRGFDVQPDTTALQVKIVPESAKSDHRAVVETANNYSLTIHRLNQFTILLSAFTLQTVYLAIKAAYSIPVTTTAVINVYTTSEYNALTDSQRNELVVLASVAVPAAGPIPAGNINRAARSLPIWEETSSVRPWPELLRNGVFAVGQVSGGQPGDIPSWQTSNIPTNAAMFWRVTDTAPAILPFHAELFYLGSGPQSQPLSQLIGMAIRPNGGIRIRIQYQRVVIPDSPGGTVTFTLTGRDSSGGLVTIWSQVVNLDTADSGYQTITVQLVAGDLVHFIENFEINADSVEYGSSAHSVFYVGEARVLAEPQDAIQQPDPDHETSLRQLHASAIVFQLTPIYDVLVPQIQISSNSLFIRNFDGTFKAGLTLGGTFIPGADLTGTLAHALTERILTTRATVGTSSRTLLWRALGAGSDAIRIYHRVTNSGGHDRESFEVTLNAAWGGSTWAKGDTATPSHRLSLDQNDLRVERQDGSSPFASFDHVPLVLPVTIASDDQAGAYTGRLTVGAALVNNAAQAIQPRFTTISTPSGTSVRTLIHLMPSGDASVPGIRIYRARVSSVERLEFVHNATWDGSQWNRETSGQASLRFTIRNDIVQVEYHASGSASAWADGSWTTTSSDNLARLLPGTQRLELQDTSIRVTSPTAVSNPAGLGSSIDPNTLYAKLIPKAWGVATSTGGNAGTFAVQEGIGVASIVFGPGSTSIDVTLTTAMASANFAVTVGGSSSTGSARIINSATLSASSFRILVADAAGTPVNLDAVAHTLMFHVFGEQDT